MTSKAQMFLAKLLIIFSVILILWGTIIEIDSNKILHPVDDVTVLAGLDDEIISITTVDSDEEVEAIVGNESTVVTNPTVVPPIDSDSSISGGSDVGNGSTVFEPNNSNTNVSGGGSVEGSTNSDSSSTTESVPTVTLEEKNALLRTQIEEAYGVKVKYGSEISSYSVGGMTTVMLTDAATVQAALINLNVALALYPTGFFKEISNYGFPLTFYLIKRYSTANVTGVTDSSYNNIVISIATDYDFADTFHHEVYHYIEKYIFSTGFRFTSWNTLNPSNFSYGTVDASYSYARTFSADAYFVNSYAQTDEHEDRASTFEYMMKSSKASCLNNGKTIWLKARLMCEQIDYFLNTVSPSVTEYWERYVY